MKNILKKYHFEFIIFCVEAICMMLELCASRVLSPFFGSSNIVWTSIIGIILLSSSIGNYFGGKIADGEKVLKKLKLILGICASFILVIPLIQDFTLKAILKIAFDVRLGAIFGSLALFFIPSALIGLITPIILKLKLKNLARAGSTSGKIYALSTLGGIFGTFLGGFFLVPNIGSVYILFLLSVFMLILIPFVDLRLKSKANIIIAIVTVLSIIAMNCFIISNKLNKNRVLNNEAGLSVTYDTQYGRVLIYNGSRNGENIRILDIDSGYESATFTDESKIYELVFEYTKYYDLMFNANIDINNTLLIGGAGYSYPKYYISHYPSKNIDVVEIDSEITELAKQYFYLDKLIQDYNLEENHRLNLITNDGRIYLNETNKKYDAILNDAFSGSSPAKTLTTQECIRNIKNALNPNGVYLTNVISALEGNESKFIRAEVNTLKQEFNYVYVVPCNNDGNTYTVQNNMVIASDSTLDLENVYPLKLSNDEIILTDDYCPVDTLIPSIK